MSYLPTKWKRSKEVFLTKLCSGKESRAFLDELQLYLSPAPSDKEQLEEKMKTNCPAARVKVIDRDVVVMWISAGSKVRKVIYNTPEEFAEDCPDMEDWKHILRIRQLFNQKWFVNENS